jgi:DNA-binding response OmpR family regulator
VISAERFRIRPYTPQLQNHHSRLEGLVRMAQAKILVIDDDEGMTELLELLLSPAASNIIIANTGKEGVELARKGRPDIVILDLMMPGMDGWEVCRAVRAFSGVPILVLSALNSPEVIAATLDVGADDFLPKPVSTSILLARINRLLQRVQIPFTALQVA